MKNVLLATMMLGAFAAPALAETVTLQDKEYQVERLIDREIGPGIRHCRFRLPSYPLNINMLVVDLNNPYNRVETTTANDKARGTELLVKAAQRQSSPGHRAVAGANANFWGVSGQNDSQVYTGYSRNASVRNGKMVVESNQHRDQWDGGTNRTGVVAMSYDKTMYVDRCTSTITATADAFGTLNVWQCNKGIHPDELCMYNSYHGATTPFLPVNINASNQHYADVIGDATEVILDFADGEDWNSGRDIKFIVKEIRLNAGGGTLGNHDLALVGRGDNAQAIAKLTAGDVVTLKYTWTYNPGKANEVTPLVEQAIGGNAMVMIGGELTKYNESEAYNSQIYSRCAYGCSADGKTMYVIVIDKSTDPVYGSSAGCNTATMCEFARWMGCDNMSNFDAGGSAEMLINGAIENRTTEGSPRAVQNGWLVYNTAPEDVDDANTVARLEFYDCRLQAPAYSTFTPQIIAYNRYGAVLDYDYKDFTLSCDASLGTCNGASFKASGTPGTGLLTATGGGVTVSKEMTVLDAVMSLRISPITIDATREYPLELIATVGGNVYYYNPADIEWTVADSDIATIDAAGTLRGVKEGATTITGRIGDFTESTTVNVEIASASAMSIADWDKWPIKVSSGITGATLDASGTIAYTYNSPRDPYISISKDYQFYSLPDGFRFSFKASTALRNVSIDIRSPKQTAANVVTLTNGNEDTFEAGKEYTIDIPISAIGDATDLITYPITIKYIRFNIKASADNKGEQSIQIGSFDAIYEHYESGIAEPAAPRKLMLTPNPVDAGAVLTLFGNAITKVEIFDTTGRAVISNAYAHADTIALDAPATAGTYVVRTTSAEGYTSSILIVK